MRIRFALWPAVLLTIVGGSINTANGLEPSRLAALAARQTLRDEVCIALSDGVISRGEQYSLLVDAKNILTPEEYQSFKQSLARLSATNANAANVTSTANSTALRSGMQSPRLMPSPLTAERLNSSAATEASPHGEVDAPIAPDPPMPYARPRFRRTTPTS
jgi:hypothetical protein